MSLAGRTISHYRIVEEISRGGMGIVYRATDTRLNRDVALKVLPAELTTDSDRRDRFIREARAASALEHPNIAVIHDVGEQDGISYIAMELIRGDKLSAAITQGYVTQSPGRAFDIAVEIAEALSRAHSQNIVHRDLKPANVMLTEDGHAKVIDFGLAKLLAPLSGSAGETVTTSGTNPEVVLGTVSYMSPEQARGGAIDHRTDIFSFGILLYEMFSNTLPFKGQSSIETMHAILHDPPPPLHLHGLAISQSVAGELQRIIEKCLAKDPEARYQGMKDLVVDLKAARRRLDSGESVAATLRVPAASAASLPAKKRAVLIAAASAALVAAAGYWFYSTQYQSPVAEATGTRPSVAVLYFENNTGNKEMDWLRTGLTDMLVTDLSQSPDVEVLSTDRLVQILGQMNKLEDRQVSFDTVQEVARRAGVKHVMLGSYIKAGDTIRINLKLQEASTGKILSTERVDAPNEASLFPTMDDLTRRLKTKFAEVSGATLLGGVLTRPGSTPPAGALDRDLKDVTTSSMEAYRAYADGIEFNMRARYPEAMPHLQRAVSIDPNFALAYVKMAVASGNMGLSNDRDRYAQRALELADRLSPRERYYIEGYYYSTKVETTVRATEAYSKLLELYPDHAASRNNLAVLYLRTDQLDKAIEQYETLRKRGFDFPGAVGSLAQAYVATGRNDRAISLMREFAEANPSIESSHFFEGMILMAGHRYDDADRAFDKALALRPNMAPVLAARGIVHLLRDDYAASREVAASLARLSAGNSRLLGSVQLIYGALLQGRTADAVTEIRRLVADQGPQGSGEGAGARGLLAEIAIARGRHADARTEIARAVADARGRMAILDILFIGSLTGAPELRAEYERVSLTLPAAASDRVLPQLTDAIRDIEGGRYAEALPILKRVDAHLPPGTLVAGAVTPIRQPRTILNFWTGRAHLGAGNDAEATAAFTRVVDAGYARLFTPIEYVRSFYYLGQIAEKRGDRARAREYYGRFLSYWKDGDIDRDKVTEAIRKMSAIS